MASPKSAAGNVVYPMQKLGLFDDEGGLTARGNQWRVDGSYPTACDEIIKEIYPDELASLTDGEGHPDKVKLVTWFQHKGLGDSNASQAAATYVMIAERSVPEPASSLAASPKSKSPATKATKAVPMPTPASTAPAATVSSAQESREGGSGGPNVHLDIQIHIPATATPEQIDQIFASMAKHLYRQ